jgi:hypothetical protein
MDALTRQMILLRGVSEFIIRYYEQLWFFLIVVPIAAMLYILFNSNQRKLQGAVFWKLVSVFNLLLYIPTILIALNVESNLLNFDVLLIYLFAYMGMGSSFIGLGLWIGYAIFFKDNAEVPREPDYPPVGGGYVIQPPAPRPQQTPQVRPTPRKPKVPAWLVERNSGKNHQLNQGTTIIGRSSRSNVQLINDPTVSSQHIKIIEDNGHYRMHDLGSTNGTWVNGFRVHQPVLLDNNDEIRLGDNTYLNFVAH